MQNVGKFFISHAPVPSLFSFTALSLKSSPNSMDKRVMVDRQAGVGRPANWRW